MPRTPAGGDGHRQPDRTSGSLRKLDFVPPAVARLIAEDSTSLVDRQQGVVLADLAAHRQVREDLGEKLAVDRLIIVSALAMMKMSTPLAWCSRASRTAWAPSRASM